MRFIGQTQLDARTQQDSEPVISPSQRPLSAQHTTHKRASLASVGFEPAIPAVKRHQTNAVDLMTTRVGEKVIYQINTGYKKKIQTRKESPSRKNKKAVSIT